MASNNSKQRLVAIAAVIVVALLAINAFLLYNKYTQDKIISSQKTELEEADKLKIELEKQYHEALSEIEEYRGANEELNDVIEQQKIELKEAKDRIAKMIRSGSDLKRARTEINTMTAQVESYIAEIQQLKGKIENLEDENNQLTNRSSRLEEDLQSQRAVSQQLEDEKTNLSNEKQALASEKEYLSNKVNIASVVKVQNVGVTGIKVKGSGKPVKKKFAKNVDQLKVCFETTINEVANPGREKFFVRIINPIGETLAIEELGSGKIINKGTGEEIRYTQVQEYDYTNDETQLCFNWEPNMSFQKGNYTVEIYNKGHLAGTGNFSLK